MSTRTPAIRKDELPSLSIEDLNHVMDLVKKHNVSPEEALRTAKEIWNNKKNEEQRSRQSANKHGRKSEKKSSSSNSLSSQASLKSISAPMEIQQKSHIYGVSTPSGRRTLQIDFVSKTFNFISGAQIQQSYRFLDLRSYDVDETIANELKLRFEDGSMDINTDSTEEKYGLERLLSTVLELNDLERIGVNLNPTSPVVSPEQMLIKKGELNKRGNTAIPVWAKRVVKIQTGEFCFYRAGDQVALNVVRLWEGNAKVKARGNDGLVIQMRAPDTRTFCFRVCSDGHKDSAAIKQERNDWLKAFKKACITRRSTLKLSKDQLQKLSVRVPQAPDESNSRRRMHIADNQFTSPASGPGQTSAGGSIGYSTGRSNTSYTESPTISRDSQRSVNIYESPEFPRDEAIGTSSDDDDSGEFEDEEVFYNNIPSPYAHQEEEVLGLLDDVISLENIPKAGQANVDPIYNNDPGLPAPPPCPRGAKEPPYARTIIQTDPTIQTPPSKKDSAPGIVINRGGKDISWQPDTNVVTQLPQSKQNTPLPAPPPPPAPPSLPANRDTSNRIKLKQIFWHPIPVDRIEQSIWHNSRPDEIQKKLALTALEELFAVSAGKQLSTTSPSGVKPGTLVAGKRAYNLGIFLKGMKTRGAALVQSLSKVTEDDSTLSVEQVATIRRFQPSVEDSEMYNNFPGEKSKLGEVDQFMMELCKIPELENRLDLTQLLWEFPHQLHCLEPTIEQMTRTCNQLNMSQKFARVLQYILCLGNYLNSSSVHGTVVQGFNLTTLDTLLDTRGRDRDYSLLHFLIDQLKVVEPDLLSFPRELPDIGRCSELSTKALEVEIEVLKNQLTLIRKTVRSLRAGVIHPAPFETKFLDDAEVFAKHHEKLLEQLQIHHNQLHHAFISVLVRFGQPMGMSSNELFTAISGFVDKFEALKQEMSGRKHSSESGPVLGQKSQSKAKVPLPQRKPQASK